MRHGLRRGGANTRGDQSGQIHPMGPDSVGDTQGQSRTRRLHQHPGGGLTSHYSRKGNKPTEVGPRDQGQRPDSYAPLLIVCLIILPTSPRAIGHVPSTSDIERGIFTLCLSQGYRVIHACCGVFSGGGGLIFLARKGKLWHNTHIIRDMSAGGACYEISCYQPG